MSFQTSAILLSWAAILLLSLVVAGLVRQVHALSGGAGPARREMLGPRPGSSAPEFDRLGPGLLLFLDRECGVCAEVLDSVVPDAAGRVSAIFSGPAPDGVGGTSWTGGTVLTDERDGLFVSYGVPATPFAVVVDASGRVRAAEPVGSPEALRELMEPEATR
ncbi:hypothetical protein GCM10010191_25890 [Actinomadura vinacea]|uniref:Thioredoxin domain-containing protein n=1 Tax=Actinomadura vinacea TaxID=115336 RepID=A0ABN3IWP1_9ACTN